MVVYMQDGTQRNIKIVQHNTSSVFVLFVLYMYGKLAQKAISHAFKMPH